VLPVISPNSSAPDHAARPHRRCGRAVCGTWLWPTASFVGRGRDQAYQGRSDQRRLPIVRVTALLPSASATMCSVACRWSRPRSAGSAGDAQLLARIEGTPGGSMRQQERVLDGASARRMSLLVCSRRQHGQAYASW